MKLHHTTGSPDWKSVPAEERTTWQRLATVTKGIITPGNGVSLLGLGLVVIGLVIISKGKLTQGLVWLIVGRCCDVLDGAVADRTNTKSPLGEAVDVGFDKIGALSALVVFGVAHIIPWWVAIMVGAQSCFLGLLGLIAKARKKDVHPLALGKISTGCLWVAFFCFILAAAHTPLWLWPAYSLLFVATGLGIPATITYARSVID